MSYTCELCGESFLSSTDLVNHMVNHTSQLVSTVKIVLAIGLIFLIAYVLIKLHESHERKHKELVNAIKAKNVNSLSNIVPRNEEPSGDIISLESGTGFRFMQNGFFTPRGLFVDYSSNFILTKVGTSHVMVKVPDLDAEYHITGAWTDDLIAHIEKEKFNFQ